MDPRESDRPQGTDAIGLEELVDFTENPEPRCACLLLLDTSESMSVPVSLVPVELTTECVVRGYPVGQVQKHAQPLSQTSRTQPRHLLTFTNICNI